MKKIAAFLITLACIADAQTLDSLGVTTIGVAYYGAANWKVGNGIDVVAPSNGIATRLFIYTNASVPATNECKLEVYSGRGEGSVLLGSGTLTNATPNQWNSVNVEFSFDEGDSLVFYVAMPASNIHGITYSGSGVYYQVPEGTANYANEPLSTLQATSQQTGTVSMFIEYEITVPLPDYYLTLTNDGHGTTTPSSLDTVDSCVASVISATANEDYKFKNWTVTSGTAIFADSTDASTTVSLCGGNATIQAVFELNPNRPEKMFPVGNSITLGYYTTGNQAYRYRLQDTLGHHVYNFVGPFENGPVDTAYDRGHGGVSGNEVHAIRDSLFIWLPQYMTNMGNDKGYILLMAGVNDANNNPDTTTYGVVVAQYEEIIDSIKSYNPAIRVVCAMVTPIDSVPRNARVIHYNNLLRAMINGKSDTVNGLIIAEVYNKIYNTENWQTLYADYLHPGDNAMPLIASAFADAIRSDTCCSMSGTTSIAFNSTATILTGLRGTTEIVLNSSATIYGSAQLGGTSDIVFGSSGLIVGSAALTGSSQIQFNSAGIISYSVTPPTITVQPVNDTTMSTASFTINATGYNPQFAWYRQGVFTGNRTLTYTFIANKNMHNDSIQCVVWNEADTISSDVVRLYVVHAIYDSVNTGDSNTIYLHGYFSNGEGWTATYNDTVSTTNQSHSATTMSFMSAVKLDVIRKRYKLILTNGVYPLNLYFGKGTTVITTGGSKTSVSTGVSPF